MYLYDLVALFAGTLVGIPHLNSGSPAANLAIWLVHILSWLAMGQSHASHHSAADRNLSRLLHGTGFAVAAATGSFKLQHQMRSDTCCLHYGFLPGSQSLPTILRFLVSGGYLASSHAQSSSKLSTVPACECWFVR